MGTHRRVLSLRDQRTHLGKVMSELSGRRTSNEADIQRVGQGRSQGPPLVVLEKPEGSEHFRSYDYVPD